MFKSGPKLKLGADMEDEFDEFIKGMHYQVFYVDLNNGMMYGVLRSVGELRKGWMERFLKSHP